MGFSLLEVLLLQHCIERMWCRVDKMDLYSPGGLTETVGWKSESGATGQGADR